MEQITVNAEFLFELQSKRDWIDKVPGILPERTRGGERLIWIDKNNNVLEMGLDFDAAKEMDSYPCKVYRPVSVSQQFEIEKKGKE